jgi:hypothetical protein
MARKFWAATAMFGMGIAVATLQAQEMPPDMHMHEMPAKNATAPAGPLHLSFGDKHAEWSPTTLAPLPHITITVYNEHAKVNQTYSGVPLATLLTRLGVPESPHGKDFRLYIVATGSDGYQVVYSLGEVLPSVHDGTVIVADTMDGKALQAAGPLQLVATGEKRPARWVRNLTTIQVRSIE